MTTALTLDDVDRGHEEPYRHYLTLEHRHCDTHALRITTVFDAGEDPLDADAEHVDLHLTAAQLGQLRDWIDRHLTTARG